MKTAAVEQKKKPVALVVDDNWLTQTLVRRELEKRGFAVFEARTTAALLAQDEALLARNLVRQLTVYATGAPVGFSDREAIEKILANCRSKGYGIRSLIHSIVQSPLFLNK